MDWQKHMYRAGTHEGSYAEIPSEDERPRYRKHIEPWLSAVFQADHLNLLIGSGLTVAVAGLAGVQAAGMEMSALGTEFDAKIEAYAQRAAQRMGRGKPNIEDQLRAALAVHAGLEVTDSDGAAALKKAIDTRLKSFLQSVVGTERKILEDAEPGDRQRGEAMLQAFLLSFASRALSRERLHIFTTNYDRLVEHGCDLAGLRVVDRFVGAVTPVFRSSRVDVDMHYNPPGIRGEPRHVEGVVRLTKLHGSLDWRFDDHRRRILREGVPFGASEDHPGIPTEPLETVVVYPNPAKDWETSDYPYADLFRDFAAAVCRSNAVVVTYGYGFGDDHINRVLSDMLTIPSTHLVIIAWEADDRIKRFCESTRPAQVSLLIGSHFADLSTLTENYLPKPTLDLVTPRLAELLKRRGPDANTNTDGAPPGEVTSGAAVIPPPPLLRRPMKPPPTSEAPKPGGSNADGD